VAPPAYLAETTLNHHGSAANTAHQGTTLVDSLVRRTKEKKIPGDWDARARKIVTGEVAPALERQIAELQAERAVGKDTAGVWALPRGPEYYRWALKASTTTNLTPDEVHQMGLEQ